MIVPCIDLQDGKVVQLVRGRRRALALDDVLAVLRRFRRYPIIHVIDLDGAIGSGRNAEWVRRLCSEAPGKLRVGGGIRSVARAERILRWGAEKIIVGSAAFRAGRVHHGFLRRLARRVGRKRIVLALDTERGSIVVRGWRSRLALRPEDVMRELEPYCSEFLCTYVDNEGTMRGTNLEWFRQLRRTTRMPITAAGGIRSRREIRALARMKMKAAVGMAIYTGRLA